MPTTLARRKKQAGFSLIAATLIASMILAFSVILIGTVISTRAAGRQLEAAVTATQIAEAGIRKAVFCLNAVSGVKCGGAYGMSYVGETDVAFTGGKYSTVVSGSGTSRTITSTGTTNKGQVRIITVGATTVPPADDISFSYAMQSGVGGTHLENNAGLSGTLYSNGNVDCQTTQAIVDGDIYVAKTGGLISKCTANYHAHADQILNSLIGQDAYYRNDPADIAGSTVNGTKYPGSPTPEPADLPSMDLDFWHQSAEAGGTYYGNKVAAEGERLGPLKIVGNLTLLQNIDVIIDGPIWVMGNILLENNSSLTLADGFGDDSTVILADNPTYPATQGFITIINGAMINGVAGHPKSHIMLASTNTSMSDTTPALSVANNAAGAVFFALNGTMRLQSNGGAKALAAKRLFIDQNAMITYVESELADMNFSNSPGGVWRLKDGTWYESAP